MQKRAFMWSLTGVAGLLGFMLTAQISSRPQKSSSSMSSYLDLRTQVEEQLQEHQILTQDILKQTSQLAQFHASDGNRSATIKALEQDAQTVDSEAGLTPMSGPGITITIQDDPTLVYVPQFANQFPQVADQEISHIVNDLFANGATAISINGQRMVTTSSIRLVSGLGGQGTLQINTFPVMSPYVITAVGDVSTMQAVLTVNHVEQELNLMQEDCIVKAYKAANGVTVPGYSGPLPGTYAKEVSGQ